MPEKPMNTYRYQYGTEARDYYEVLPNPSREIEKRKRALPRKANNFAFVFQLSLCGIVLFSSTFLYISMYSSLNMKQNELKVLKDDLRETKSSINEIQSEMAAKLNLGHIQQVATTKLHMREPLPHQVIYVELPKQSYTVYEE